MRFQPRYFEGRFNLHQRAYTLMEHQGDAKFVYHSLDFMQDEIARKAVKSTVLSLRLPIIQKFTLPVPNLREQQKIADCLFSLDEVIAAEGDRLAALRDYKKGLMQQLFPRPERIKNGEKVPAETTPRLRFPEFQNAGEWEERSLAQISPAIFDGTHQTPTYVEEGVPFYSVENLVSGNKNKFISQADHDLATTKNKPEIGDVLITRIGKIGFSRLIDWSREFSIYVTLAVVKRSPKFNSGYLNSYFQSDRYQVEIHQRSLLNAVPCKINMDELRRSRVLLPTVPEQERIADCLRYCDASLDAQLDKIAALKAHKLGLMQQLFPSSGEASA
jgi:type I restriction enzyme S subunit